MTRRVVHFRSRDSIIATYKDDEIRPVLTQAINDPFEHIDRSTTGVNRSGSQPGPSGIPVSPSKIIMGKYWFCS